jgi:hypothetical protein
MRIKMIVVELALLASLAGCAGAAPQGQSALGGQATARSDASPTAAASQHMLPVWADPEFIKS